MALGKVTILVYNVEGGNGGTGIKTPTLTDSCSDWIKWINKQVNKFQIIETSHCPPI
jgi:hypothetical protein